MSPFVPNNTIRIKPSKPAWLTKEIKNVLRMQNRKYEKYKNNGFRKVDRIILDHYTKECNEEIEKQNYLSHLGRKLTDKNREND